MEKKDGLNAQKPLHTVRKLRDIALTPACIKAVQKTKEMQKRLLKKLFNNGQD